jgi:nicotinate-nucleotide adenylyltransferase
MRLGIMGGTFDPVHSGHLCIAGAAMREAELEGVLFLPDGDPPHKKPGATGEDRLAMVTLALEGYKGFAASDMELRRAGRTYTVDTLVELLAQDPGRELYYIIGSDTLALFPTWKTAWKVAGLCRMMVAPRPGNDQGEIRWLQRKLFADFGLSSTLLKETGPDISSTRIRQMVRQGESIDALVPAPVARYIREKGLYLE